jgi:arylsulfatase A-like enzyme
MDTLKGPQNNSQYGAAYWTGPGQRISADDISLDGDDSRVIMDRLLPFIEEATAKHQAFFTTVWFHTPHEPIVADPADVTYQQLDGYSQGQKDYYTIVTAMDRQIGRLMDKLEQLGQTENTLIFFTSDNGASEVFAGSNGQLRGHKVDLYEGGIRVPGIASWPGKIKAGSVTDTTAITSDYFPTLTALWQRQLKDSPLPLDRELDGQSLLSLLLHLENPVPERQLGFAYTNWDQPQGQAQPQRLAYIGQQYKLLSYDWGVSYQLYDLHKDPAETQDIAMQYPEKVEQLKAAWNTWYDSVKKSRAGGDY